MNLFQKAKNFVKNKLSRKSELNEPTEAKEKQELNKEISLVLVDKLTQYSIDPPNTPAGLTSKQWRSILNQIIWAWQHACKGYTGSSIKRKKINKLKVLVGFKLFVRYFKDIK